MSHDHEGLTTGTLLVINKDEMTSSVVNDDVCVSVTGLRVVIE